MQTSEKNWLEKLMDKIPGLSGYQAREGRRDTDKRLREYMASQLDRVKDRIEDAKLALTNQGNLQALNEVGLLQRRLQGVTDSIRFATYGYSGLFDQVKVREAELEQIYAHDLKMMDVVESLQKLVEDPAHTAADAMAAVQALDELVAQRKHLWDNPGVGGA
jgi:hypothetical protein